jgi:histidine triad (HIT) family protein
MCIFCNIVDGLIPSYKLHEDETHLVFLSYPQAVVPHVLIIPKQHIPNLKLCPDELLSKTILLAKEVAIKIEKLFQISDVNILTNCGVNAGQTIDHFHFHVLARTADDKLTISFPTTDLDQSRFEALHKLLQW